MPNVTNDESIHGGETHRQSPWPLDMRPWCVVELLIRSVESWLDHGAVAACEPSQAAQKFPGRRSMLADP